MIEDVTRPGQPTSELRIPNVSEIDFNRLRAARLHRLQTAMKKYNIAAGLFFNPANIRYATGTDVMGVYTAGTLSRYCIVPAESPPILFEYRDSMHISRRIVADVRHAYSWQYGGEQSHDRVTAWAREIRSVLEELRLAAEPLAVDRADTLGVLSLLREDLKLVDSGPVTVDAREIKTHDEIEILKINGGIGDAMLSQFEAAIRPGVREFELFATLSQSLLANHGEFLATRLVASGQNTNPWMSEAHDKLVQPGDLVGVDTDATGYEGYVIDVSRTFLCGDRATPQQKDAYRIAHEHVTGMAEILKVGMSFEDFARNAPQLPRRFVDQRYMAMAHQAGLEIEGPGIPYLEDLEDPAGGHAVMPDREIKVDMVLCLEAYMGEVGAAFGVKLEDQVIMTEHGAKLLCTYPYDSALLD